MESNAVRLRDLEDTGTVPYFLEGYIPLGHNSMIYGEGNTGKSYIAMALAVCAASGKPFAGISIRRATGVLYVDFELDPNVQRERAIACAAGMDMNQLDPGLWYLRPEELLPGAIEEIKTAARLTESDFIIVDSLGVGCAGLDTQKESVITDVLYKFHATGLTVLLIDHQAKQSHDASYRDRTPYGSVYKYNLNRSVMQIKRVHGGIELAHTKNTFGEMLPHARFDLVFGPKFTITPREDEVLPLNPNKVEVLRLLLLEYVSERESIDLTSFDVAKLAPDTSAVEIGRQLSALGLSSKRVKEKDGWRTMWHIRREVLE